MSLSVRQGFAARLPQLQRARASGHRRAALATLAAPNPMGTTAATAVKPFYWSIASVLAAAAWGGMAIQVPLPQSLWFFHEPTAPLPLVFVTAPDGTACLAGMDGSPRPRWLLSGRTDWSPGEAAASTRPRLAWVAVLQAGASRFAA
ncbi:hypothetical protein KH5H1_65380 [Corallococcus caeni]|nr:hypothetical protein KH5H1_65380 [Corallococcus sp. KH5-1]